MQGRMLARAASKMALNNMVIRRGAFVDPTAAKETALGGDGLMELLQPMAEEAAKGAPQSRAVTDKVRCMLRHANRAVSQNSMLCTQARTYHGSAVVACDGSLRSVMSCTRVWENQVRTLHTYSLP